MFFQHFFNRPKAFLTIFQHISICFIIVFQQTKSFLNSFFNRDNVFSTASSTDPIFQQLFNKPEKVSAFFNRPIASSTVFQQAQCFFQPIFQQTTRF